jgi:hypothetical protein
MKKIISTLFLFLLILGLHAQSSHVYVQIPSAEMEVQYIWQNIRDIEFFERNNYQLSLPHHELIEELKTKAKKKELEQKDYDRLLSTFSSELYKPDAYTEGYEKIERELSRIEKIFETLSTYQKQWGFHEFNRYQVNLTLYGPGGSYDPDRGSILIMTNEQGGFKGYQNPSYTIIHEIVHIGIEAPIVQRFKLSHTLKERIVDLFVSLHFPELVPDYQLQSFGDKRIDSCLTSTKDFEDLPAVIERFLQNN